MKFPIKLVILVLVLIAVVFFFRREKYVLDDDKKKALDKILMGTTSEEQASIKKLFQEKTTVNDIISNTDMAAIRIKYPLISKNLENFLRSFESTVSAKATSPDVYTRMLPKLPRGFECNMTGSNGFECHSR